jgi:hypothetical protein
MQRILPILGLLALTNPASAIPFPQNYVVINNGLAPPNPENVIGVDNSISGTALWVLVAGCLPNEECGWPQDPTHVSIAPGGSVIGDVWIDDGQEGMNLSFGSRVSVDGGRIVGNVFSTNGAFDISDGEVTGIVRLDFADHSTMSGGVVGGIHIVDWGFFDLSGGTVLGGVLVGHGGTLTLTGGTVDGNVRIAGLAHTKWRGGTIDGQLNLIDAAETTIFGSDFAIDGVPIPYGQSPSLGGLLTGTLENGDQISNLFTKSRDYEGSRLYFVHSVPEPSTAVLLALGLACLARRRVLE